MLRSLLACVALAVVAAAAATAATPATLRVASDVPLTLQGAGFRPAETVRVSILSGASRFAARARTTAGGSFTVRFPMLRLKYCAVPLSITARGEAGDFARAHVARRECAAP